MSKNTNKGRPKKPEMKYFGVKLDDQTIQAIRVLSEDTGVSQGAIIKAAIQRTFEPSNG
jgi:hypothetical protein